MASGNIFHCTTERVRAHTHTHDDDVESGGEECSDLKDEVIKKLIFATAADSETAQLTRI